VHEDHGIARFTGFETKTVGGVTRDYLELEYKDGDRVFVPSDQLHKISRYVGAGAGDPPLSKLGGKTWEQMKLRARRAAQALAGELINLYAERKRRAGHPFPPDGEWQLDFENAFPYRETPDQLDAIEHVKADMEEARRRSSRNSTSAPSPNACATTRSGSRWRRGSGPPRRCGPR
jgi:transcription-repair coupling factor (superfamily II helicase)